MLRATTTDDTSTAWAASAAKELAIGKVAGATASTYTVPAAVAGDTSALMYLATMVKATTVPTLAAVPITVGASALSPSVGITTSTSDTTPDLTDGTQTYVFGTTGTLIPYGYVIGA